MSIRTSFASASAASKNFMFPSMSCLLDDLPKTTTGKIKKTGLA